MGRYLGPVLIVLGLLPIAGRFVPATAGWGFDHAAFLPIGIWIASIVGLLLILLPGFRRFLDRVLYDRFGPALFGGPVSPAAVCVAVAAVVFYLLRVPTHLLGDGVLVAELVGHGSDFRIHDLMDYLLHRVVLNAFGRAGSVPTSFLIYRIGSILAGILAMITALALLRRSRLPVEAKTAIFLLWFLGASSLLYFGYVESYGFLSVAMLGFVWSGAMAQRGEITPWAPGLFFGLALFFHTIALLAAPALLWLMFRPGPRRARRGRWVGSILIPALFLPLAAVIIHVALGYNGDWIRRDLIESKNQRHMLVALTGSHGLLSWTHLKDILNWLILVVPITGALVFAGAQRIRDRWGRPETPFLVIQTGVFLIAFLLLDRKLGSARDWDIFAPHVAGLVWLAGTLLVDEESRSVEGSKPVQGRAILSPLRTAAPWTAMLLFAPWLAVNASRGAALERFERMKADFATFPRAYATEELAKYYRDHHDLENALRLYREGVGIYPRNARTHVLLGGTYLALGRFEEAIEEFDESIKLDPKGWMGLDMKAKALVRMNDYERGIEAFRLLTPRRAGDGEAWTGYGYCALRLRKYDEANIAFQRAAALRRDPQILYFTGLTFAYLRRWDDSISWLTRAVGAGSDDPLTFYALAGAIEGRAADRIAGGEAVDPDELRRALETARRAAQLSPDDPAIARLVSHLERVVAGQEAPTALFGRL